MFRHSFRTELAYGPVFLWVEWLLARRVLCSLSGQVLLTYREMPNSFHPRASVSSSARAETVRLTLEVSFPPSSLHVFSPFFLIPSPSRLPSSPSPFSPPLPSTIHHRQSTHSFIHSPVHSETFRSPALCLTLYRFQKNYEVPKNLQSPWEGRGETQDNLRAMNQPQVTAVGIQGQEGTGVWSRGQAPEVLQASAYSSIKWGYWRC